CVSRKGIANHGAIHCPRSRRIVDDYWTPLSIRQRGKITCAFGACRQDYAEASRLDIVIVLRGKPEECPVLDDGTTDTATSEIVGIVRFGYSSLLAEEIVLLRPNRTSLKETRSVKVAGPGFQCCVEHAAARAPHLGIVGVHLNLDVFEGFNCGVRRRAIPHVGDRNAVQRVVIAAPCSASERDQRRVRLILLPVELSVPGWDNCWNG